MKNKHFINLLVSLVSNIIFNQNVIAEPASIFRHIINDIKHPVTLVRAQPVIKIEEFYPKPDCGIYLRKPPSKNVVFNHRLDYDYAEMKINGEIVRLRKYREKNNNAQYLSLDGKIRVQFEIIKFGRFLYGEYQEIDRAILTVSKGNQQVKITVVGGSGC